MTDPWAGPEPRVSFDPWRGAFGGPASWSLTGPDADRSQAGSQLFQKGLFLDFRAGTHGRRRQPPGHSRVIGNAVNTDSFSMLPLLLLGGKISVAPGMWLRALPTREVSLSRPTPNTTPKRGPQFKEPPGERSSSVYVLKMFYAKGFKYKIRPRVLLRRSPKPRK